MIKRLKEILRNENMTGKELAKMLDTTYSTYRSMTRKKRKGFPKWVKAFVVGYNLGKFGKNSR